MTRPAATRESGDAAVVLDQLVELLADALAPRLAQLLATPVAPAATDGPPSRRLLTIDELVALLPAGKRPPTWKSWLYQRTRLGQVPGCHKLGNRLFFNPDETLPWLLNPGANAETAARLDLSGKQSLHGQAMPHEPRQRPLRPEKP
jgi:hypothetical protein